VVNRERGVGKRLVTVRVSYNVPPSPDSRRTRTFFYGGADARC